MELYELASRAFSGTSFSPERRAKDTVEWIEEMLKEDLRKIGAAGSYEAKFMDHVHKWLNAKSRCMSSMITGPANFPVARNRKNMGYEDSAYKNWMAWREKYIKAVFRVPTPSPEEDLDKALADYEKAFLNQVIMRTVNKIVRSKKTTAEKKTEQLSELEFSDSHIKSLLEPDCHGVSGFPSYALTNNNAKIKRLEEKVITMKARIERKDSFQPIEVNGAVIDIQNDRVTITHKGKPAQSVIDSLKSRGFRWSRNYGCWCRKHTANALYAAKQIVGYREPEN